MATAKRRSAGEAITPTISWFASLTDLRVVIYLGFWKSGKSDGCSFCSMLARRQELNTVANQRPQPGARFSRLGQARSRLHRPLVARAGFQDSATNHPGSDHGPGGCTIYRATDFRLYRGFNPEVRSAQAS